MPETGDFYIISELTQSNITVYKLSINKRLKEYIIIIIIVIIIIYLLKTQLKLTVVM